LYLKVGAAFFLVSRETFFAKIVFWVGNATENSVQIPKY